METENEAAANPEPTETERPPVVTALYHVAAVVRCDCGTSLMFSGENDIKAALFGKAIVTTCGKCGARVVAQRAPTSPMLAMNQPRNRHERRAEEKRTAGGIIVPR